MSFLLAPGTLRVPPAAAGTSASLYVRVETLMVSPSHSSFLPTLLVCELRVCAANSFGLPGRSPGNARARARSQFRAPGFFLCLIFSHAEPGSARCQFRARGPYLCRGLHTRWRSALHFRNYRSLYTQSKAPLSASPVGAGLILPPHREGPYSPFTPPGRARCQFRARGLYPMPGPSHAGVVCTPPQELSFALHANQAPSGRVSGGGGSYPSPAPGGPSQPTHAPLARVPEPAFRNEYSPHTPARPLPAEKDGLRHLLTVC